MLRATGHARMVSKHLVYASLQANGRRISSVNRARRARRALVRSSFAAAGQTTSGKHLTLTRALRARRARPPEVPEKGSMKEPKVHPYIGCTFGGIEVFRAARACAVLFLFSGKLHNLPCFPVGYFCGNSEQRNHPVKVLLLS